MLIRCKNTFFANIFAVSQDTLTKLDTDLDEVNRMT